MDLTTFLAQLESRVKSQESNLKSQIILILGHFFSKFLKYFCGSDIFSCLVVVQSNKFFSSSTYL